MVINSNAFCKNDWEVPLGLSIGSILQRTLEIHKPDCEDSTVKDRRGVRVNNRVNEDEYEKKCIPNIWFLFFIRSMSSQI